MAYDPEILRALRALARYSFTKDQIASAKENFAKRDIDWVKLVASLFRNKIAGLAYYNILRFELEVPFFAREALRLYYAANVERNRVMLEEALHLRDRLIRFGVDARPLKGAVLIPSIYSDLGSRFVNDIDMFIDRRNIAAVDDAMTEMGFTQGKILRTGGIVEHSRENRALWSLKMFNLMPYLAARESAFAPVVHVDFAFGLLFEHRADVSARIMAREGVIGGCRTLAVEDFLIHLCTHLYKEATMEAAIAIGQDFNLIKFVDLMEFIHHFHDLIDINALRLRAAELEVGKPMYFALSGVAEILEDERSAALLASLGFDFAGDSTFTEVRRQGGRVVAVRSRSMAQLIATV